MFQDVGSAEDLASLGFVIYLFARTSIVPPLQYSGSAQKDSKFKDSNHGGTASFPLLPVAVSPASSFTERTRPLVTEGMWILDAENSIG